MKCDLCYAVFVFACCVLYEMIFTKQNEIISQYAEIDMLCFYFKYKVFMFRMRLMNWGECSFYHLLDHSDIHYAFKNKNG